MTEVCPGLHKTSGLSTEFCFAINLLVTPTDLLSEAFCQLGYFKF